MERFLAIALLILIFTARDEQSGDCIRKGKCKDMRIESSYVLPYQAI